MSRRNALLFLLAATSSVLPLTLRGGGMRLASQDGFATARGEAFVATADNPSAIYYNPAGITQLEGSNVRAGIYGIYLDPSFTPPPPSNTNEFHIKNKLAAVPQLFYTCSPPDSLLSFGLGIYAPFGLGVNWPQDTGFRAVATGGSLTYATINPVVALKLAPGLSVGAGITANYAQMELEQGLLRFQRPLTNYFRFNGDGWSAGYNLGVLWQPHPKIALGATFRSSTAFTLEGETEFEQFPVIPATHRSAQADFSFPLDVVVGISWRPTPQWNLEFDADFTDWRSFGTTTIQQAPPPWPVKRNIPLTLNWQQSWMYEFGVTRYLNGGWHVSAGYVFSENSVPDANYTPLAADMDRHFFSVGTGVKGKRYNFDVAYQFGYGPDRTVTGSTPPSVPARNAGQNADGTYGFLSHALLVTVGMRF